MKHWQPDNLEEPWRDVTVGERLGSSPCPLPGMNLDARGGAVSVSQHQPAAQARWAAPLAVSTPCPQEQQPHSNCDLSLGETGTARLNQKLNWLGAGVRQLLHLHY